MTTTTRMTTTPRGRGRTTAAGCRGADQQGVARAPVAGTALDLLDRSRSGLLAACCAGGVTERYLESHLAALRAAAALLAARSRPTRRARLRSVWEVLPEVAPELTEWAVFFAASAQRRAAFERGASVPVAREADDLLRAAEAFFALVQGALGLPPSRPLPEFTTATGRQ